MRDQRFQTLRQRPSVGRDVQAGIVGKIDRRDAEIAGKRGAMVVIAPGPLQVAHAKTMDQHNNAPAGFRVGFCCAGIAS